MLVVKETRLKYLVNMLPLTILFILAVMVFSAVYSSGTVHRFPHAFAIDNGERLYQLFYNGGYCWANGKVIGVYRLSEKSARLMEDNNKW